MPVYKKRATKVKKPPRIAQTQRTQQKVSQRVVVHIEQPKARVRKVAPRAMGTKDYQLKALLTRPMMPTPIQTGFDAAEAARAIAAQEKKLNDILELQAKRVIQEEATRQTGYYGTPVLQMAPPVAPPVAPPAPPPQGLVPAPPPPPPPKPQMTEEQKDAARAIQVAAEELDDLRKKKSSTAFLGMSGEEWAEARKKLKKTPPASVASEEEEPAAPSKPPVPPPAPEPAKEKETPSKKMGRPPIPEGTLTIGQMNDIKEKVLAGKAMTYDALAKYAKALKMEMDKKMKGSSAGAKSRRMAFGKKIYDKLSREGVYD